MEFWQNKFFQILRERKFRERSLICQSLSSEGPKHVLNYWKKSDHMIKKTDTQIFELLDLMILNDA
ncbi:hypothetical protein BpHYR1_042558 [Brachionus plicatilis]|uniref:Uncharacterized protein n=1 Tax=Brachionus plicatilis TaxID=10195 RepID=A0A3M7RRF8_BRAPC|nr:hypothetical protein BpHYR1_042558 [Brachionus plicatilis]